jgi:beta-glucosidase
VTNGFQVSFDLTNTGNRAGAEVAQVYLGLPSSAGEPPKRLVGWQKVFLQPQQMQSVTVTVNANDSSHPLSYWDATSSSWRIASGEYSVYLGNSSSNITLVGTFQVAP